MKISIVTPVYNGEKFLTRMLDSIYSQKGDFEIEHIVCDALSTDRTMDILQNYPITKIIRRKDNGPFDAIIYGFKEATGDVGAWLNADDMYAPGALAKVTDIFQKKKNCQWLYGKCSIVDEEDQKIRQLITVYKNFIGYFFNRNILLCENYINQPATFWRMDLWRKVNPMLQEYRAAWDYELWLKFSQLCPAHHMRESLAMFRRHNESISESFTNLQFKEELEICKKYGNCIHRQIHSFNYWKIIFCYSLLVKLSK